MEDTIHVPTAWVAGVTLFFVIAPFVLRAVGHIFPRVSAVGLRILGDLGGAWEEAKGSGVIQASFKQKAAEKKHEALPPLPNAKP